MTKIIKIKITNQLEKLRILRLLELQYRILDTSGMVDLDQLAARLSCDSALLLEVCIEMGCGIIEDR
jgi:hypothetical protein